MQHGRNLDTEQWQELDRLHHLHPFTDSKSLHHKGSRVITRADGVYLWDSEGRKILDAMAGLWCVNIGYGREELARVAYEQMQQLPYYNTFFQTTHPPAVDLAELLSQVTPAHLNHVFFTNSGSEANDTVVRLVRHYWSARGKGSRKIIISRENAYHGSTIAGASLGGMKPMHKQGGLPIPDIEHITQPYWYTLGGDLSPEEFGLQAARALEDKILELGADRVAAFIGEPIQGAGGVIVPPRSYWPEISRICKKYEVLLVADEVICGFGRTGKWFASEYFGIEADLMSIAKGLSSGYLPIGGVMISDAVADVLINQGGEFQHGFTYSGHPTCCAVAAANIRILRDERIIERAEAETAPYLQARIREFESHPLVGEVRGVGMFGAVQLAKDKSKRSPFDSPGEAGNLCKDHCTDNDLIMRAVGDSMILSPPLIISKTEIDELMEKAGRAIDLTARDLGIS
ncbi:MAG: aspartate aminotransferase family protein [Gammaproteobacteria bacterium]|nr:aspartate aminotransferase family protein [Gammaproteobacteria bacterium]MDX2458906.1 aspartate aminotransferase family protein [Gammaproteobacteria bacterium]